VEWKEIKCSVKGLNEEERNGFFLLEVERNGMEREEVEWSVKEWNGVA